ncbi:MAG: thioesterase family protein [Gemmatimonadota bacterium]
MTTREFTSTFHVRSYELDGLGHLNHAVYLNYLEQARYDTLSAAGFTLHDLQSKGWAVHVVRIEADYRRECRYGDRLEVRTGIERFRSSSMILRQRIFRVEGSLPDSAVSPPSGEVALEARIVAVWIGPDGRPMRIPEEARSALASLAAG